MSDDNVIVRTVRLADGAELAVSQEGVGPDIMLVSGLGGTAGFWSPAAARLTGRFRVTRFDQRGIGASSRGTAACTIDRLALDGLAVADVVGLDRFVFVGHSTGGAIGQALARLAPARIAALGLSGTWLKPSRYMAAVFAARRKLLDLDPTAYAATGALFGYAPAWLEQNWSTYEKAVAAAPTSPSDRAVVRERIDALLAFDGAPHAPALGLPTLVLGARDDAIVPAFLQEELAAALPRPEVVMFDDGGHFFPVTRTEDFVAAVSAFAGRQR